MQHGTQAFDPALPAEGRPLVSAEMRSQLNGLAVMINSVPAGPQGPPFAGAEVESTVTLPPFNPPSVYSGFYFSLTRSWVQKVKGMSSILYPQSR